MRMFGLIRKLPSAAHDNDRHPISRVIDFIDDPVIPLAHSVIAVLTLKQFHATRPRLPRERFHF